LHGLLHAAQKERSELMRNVSQLEQNNDALSEELAQARDDHLENVRELTAKAQQEMEEALEAARNDWEQQRRAELIRLRQEFDREKSQVCPTALPARFLHAMRLAALSFLPLPPPGPAWQSPNLPTARWRH
jgi:predicted  nucleic acid-binding Zn-ribbon protein